MTLVAMFLNSLLEKMEHNLLERVDQHIDEELAHRFVRNQQEAGATVMLTPPMQHLLETQVGLWTASMQKAEERWTQIAPQMAKALEQALDAALTRFGQRIVETEKKLLERQNVVLDGLARLVTTIEESGSEHEMSLARLTDAINLSVEVISKSRAMR